MCDRSIFSDTIRGRIDKRVLVAAHTGDREEINMMIVGEDAVQFLEYVGYVVFASNNVVPWIHLPNGMQKDIWDRAEEVLQRRNAVDEAWWAIRRIDVPVSLYNVSYNKRVGVKPDPMGTSSTSMLPSKKPNRTLEYCVKKWRVENDHRLSHQFLFEKTLMPYPSAKLRPVKSPACTKIISGIWGQ